MVVRKMVRDIWYLSCFVAGAAPLSQQRASDVYFKTSACTNALVLLGPVTRTVMR